jgi:putative Mn2+ efflux pump MntP
MERKVPYEAQRATETKKEKKMVYDVWELSTSVDAVAVSVSLCFMSLAMVKNACSTF